MKKWQMGKCELSDFFSLPLSRDACWGSGSGFILLTAMSNSTGRRVLSSALGISSGSEGNPLFAWCFPKATSAWLLPPCPSPGGPTWPAHYTHSAECEWAVRWGVLDAPHDPSSLCLYPHINCIIKIHSGKLYQSYTEHNHTVLYADSKHAISWVEKELEKLFSLSLFFFFTGEYSDCVGVEL